MPVLVLIELETGVRPHTFADHATACKVAVNELIGATHDALPAARGDVRDVLQRTFTLLSERTVSYEERYRRGRQMWRRVRVLAEDEAEPPPLRGLVDVLVLEEADLAKLQAALRG